jgi:hypothetical protein
MGTFRLFGKVPRADALVIVLVAGTTLAFDLAVAVCSGWSCRRWCSPGSMRSRSMS